MSASSMFTTSLSNSSVLYQNLKVSSSEQPGPWFSGSSMPSVSSAGLVMSCFTMIFGAISNLSALGILANSCIRFHSRSKVPFLLLTDGRSNPSFALYLHMERYHMQTNVHGRTFCQIFGASMVFFGLCPLLLGCAMAVERCVAITQPFFHAAMITVAHVLRVVVLLSSVAFLLAVLPFFGVGTYTLQFPGTWCFLPIIESHSIADGNLILAFSCLGLTAQSLSLFCNIFSGLALLLARIRPHTPKKKSVARASQRTSSALSSSLFRSLDMEMMLQLAVITVVSCACWGPFLIQILVMQFNQTPSTREKAWVYSSGPTYGSLESDFGPLGLHPIEESSAFQNLCVYRQKPKLTTKATFQESLDFAIMTMSRLKFELCIMNYFFNVCVEVQGLKLH